MKKILLSAIYLLIGFLSGIMAFVVFALSVNSSGLSSTYYSWYQNSSNSTHLIVGGFVFILGEFLSIFGLDLILKKLSTPTKLLLVIISSVLTWLLIFSIQDWWFLN